MHKKSLQQIKRFAQPFYSKAGEYHGWDHILKVRGHALRLAQQYKKVNRFVLEAACYLHDIGRSVKDKGHEQKSVELAKVFLQKLGVSEGEIVAICHAIRCHVKERVKNAKTPEAKLLFDADKLEIMSVYGFLRVTMFLVQERKMALDESIKFLWNYVASVRKSYLQTSQAKKIVDREIKVIKRMVNLYNNWA